MDAPAGRYRRTTLTAQQALCFVGEDDDALGEPTTLVGDAHAAGLAVVVYTFRNENEYLPSDLRIGDDPSDYGDAIAEYLAFYEAGIDGVWSDNPDTALIAREEFLRDR
jgi:glycerophosphoryl diester phosphodiesterase